MTAPSPVVAVVAAVIERDDRFLVTKRVEGAHLAGLWEFPGGKVHAAESHDDALRRELVEELDVAVVVGDLLIETTHAYPEKTVRIFFYRCMLEGTPRPMLGQAMAWVSRQTLSGLDFPAADAALVRRLAQALD